MSCLQSEFYMYRCWTQRESGDSVAVHQRNSGRDGTAVSRTTYKITHRGNSHILEVRREQPVCCSAPRSLPAPMGSYSIDELDMEIEIHPGQINKAGSPLVGNQCHMDICPIDFGRVNSTSALPIDTMHLQYAGERPDMMQQYAAKPLLSRRDSKDAVLFSSQWCSRAFLWEAILQHFLEAYRREGLRGEIAMVQLARRMSFSSRIKPSGFVGADSLILEANGSSSSLIGCIAGDGIHKADQAAYSQ